MSKSKFKRRKLTNGHKHGIIHGIFQGCGHGTYGYLSLINIPELPFTSSQESDIMILIVGLIIGAVVTAKGCKLF